MPEITITLKVVGAGEDYPRLLTGYRRIKGGLQFAIALRPHESRLLLAVVPKGETGRLYHAVDLDAPTWPSQDTPVKDIASLLAEAQKKLPKTGPIIMRGQWRGKLFVDPDAQALRIELVRKIASYGTLTIIGQDGRWTWRFARSEKYFSSPRTTHSPAHQHFDRLSEVIKQGYAEALDIVGEACSIKDTRRRQALDSEYAQRRPIRPPRERTTEPLDRFKLPKPPRGKTPRKKAGSCDICATDAKPLKAGGRPIPVAPTAVGLKKQADALKADAETLTTASSPAQAMSVDAVIDFFINHTGIPGFLTLSERIRDYAKGRLAPLDRTIPLADFIVSLRRDASKAVLAQADSHTEADEIGKGVGVAITALEMALSSAPAQLNRARNLIRYAKAAADSPKCSGPEEAEARQAIARAEASYEEARKALVKGGEGKALTAIRQSAAWLALSASKIAASCKVGQKSLLGRTPKKATPPSEFAPGDALAAKKTSFLSTPSASTAKGWMKLALSQRGLTASRLSARSKTASGKTSVTLTVSGITDSDTIKTIEWLLPTGLTVNWSGTTPATKPARTKKTRTKKTTAPAAGGMSATDAALMAAFQQAIAAAVSGASA